MSEIAPEVPVFSDPAPQPGPVGRMIGRSGILERRWTPPVFLALTIATVFYVGIDQAIDFFAQTAGKTLVWSDPAVLYQAFIYTGALMAILGTHEMGHWLVARAHRVHTSLPIFIPVPFGVGTFGAVISMTGMPRTRAALLRIGAAGPLAGGVVALAIMAVALHTCPEAKPVDPASGILLPPVIFGSSLGMRLLEFITGTTVIESDTAVASPLFMAAWVGFLLTSINLLPIGQLDGGHVAYAIFGRRMNTVARPLAMAVMALCIPGSMGGGFAPTYLFWGLVVFLFISWHPPLEEPEESLPADAWVLAAASLLLFALTFMLAPITVQLVTPAGS